MYARYFDLGPVLTNPVILFESVKFYPSFMFVENDVVDEIHVEVPVFALLATFFELEEHGPSPFVFLCYLYLTLRHK